MQDDTLRRRLEALNREPLPESYVPKARVASPDVATSHSASRGPDHSRGALSKATASTVQPIAGLLRQGEEVATSAGKHLRIVLPVETFWPNAEALIAARQEVLRESTGKGRLAGETRQLLNAFPDSILYLDLETCGLAGAALFLAGLLRQIDGKLAIELLLARSYAEEHAVLISLWQRAAVHDVLVTYNGKSFDWPMVHDRSTRYHLGHPISSTPLPLGGRGARGEGETTRGETESFTTLSRTTPRPNPFHVDILHHARRRWRGHLPNCKLQTLEKYICGRHRKDDIPGAEIPAAYQRFVEQGSELEQREMNSILFHNALDLVTLLDLSLRLAV